MEHPSERPRDTGGCGIFGWHAQSSERWASFFWRIANLHARRPKAPGRATQGVLHGSCFEVFGEPFPGDVESAFDRAIAAERGNESERRGNEEKNERGAPGESFDRAPRNAWGRENCWSPRLRHRPDGRCWATAVIGALYAAASSNCASSVEPAKAVTDVWPLEMVVISRSKKPVPTNFWCLTAR
jgi:hypothetical protein